MKKYKNKVSQLGNAAKVADVIYAPPPLSSSFYMYQGGTKYVYNIFCRLCINMFYVIVKKKFPVIIQILFYMFIEIFWRKKCYKVGFVCK